MEFSALLNSLPWTSSLVVWARQEELSTRNWRFAILLGSLWRDGAGMSQPQPTLCHCWSLSPFQTPTWAGAAEAPAGAQSPGQSWWCGASASFMGQTRAGQKTAKHSRGQWSGKNSGKHKASDLASEFQPSSLLVSSHWGRGTQPQGLFSA